MGYHLPRSPPPSPFRRRLFRTIPRPASARAAVSSSDPRRRLPLSATASSGPCPGPRRIAPHSNRTRSLPGHRCPRPSARRGLYGGQIWRRLPLWYPRPTKMAPTLAGSINGHCRLRRPCADASFCGRPPAPSSTAVARPSSICGAPAITPPPSEPRRCPSPPCGRAGGEANAVARLRADAEPTAPALCLLLAPLRICNGISEIRWRCVRLAGAHGRPAFVSFQR